jgi:hypothetical protein
MKKVISTCLLILAFISSMTAKQIDQSTAMTVGQNFLKTRVTSSTLGQNLNLNLVYTLASLAKNANSKTKPLNYFFVFNINDDKGYVIVSADDIVIPVLGYSDEIGFDPNKIPSNVSKWLEGYKGEIRYAITNNLAATPEITKEWTDLIKGTFGKQKLNKKGSVNPLVKTKWNQSPYYNSLCPYDKTAKENAVTGCVATAMAQVMKFWNYPSSGTGFHSYNEDNYGTLSANFGSTTYDWSSMPNQVTSTNTAVATLMYHCGVGVDMNYGVNSSGAYVISSASQGTHCAEYALKTYFGYKSTLKGIRKSNYTTSQWLSTVKAEFDAGRPIVYAGFGNGGGHCFVSDGYDNNDYLHFNWGWNGSYDGYFLITALNPGGTGTGGGTGKYNSDQQAVIGIEPPSGSTTYNLDITVDLEASSSDINYGDAFTVSTNIKNKGTTTFKGTYCTAIFDKDNKFVDYVDSVVESNGLQANYTYSSDLVFSYAGSYNLLPGSYTILMFYRPVGGNWKQIFSSGSYSYYTTINIKYSNTIEMYSDMTLTPTEFVKGKSASVNLNLLNTGTATFYGDYEVNLYNLDGSFAETIATINETNGLPYNYTYSSPYLTFSSTEITSEPGTYLLAAVFKSNSSSSYDLVGSSSFQNPIKVNVTEPEISPDKYEVNNVISQAYSLSLSYTNNVSKPNTADANCHTGTDYDYYKVVLPSGYNYTIKAELLDLYNNNSNEYTLDGLFSYSTDGTTWSDAYDDKMPNDITVNNGGTVYFLNSPYFTGETGTYLLDLYVTRSPILSSARNITAFTVGGIVGTATIDTNAATVKLTVNSSTNITSLTPTISISNYASINPGSSIARDFTNPISYTVTAQDNSTKVWSITVTRQSGSINDRFTHSDLVKVYPNPAKDFIGIDLLELQLQTNQIQIIDMQGKINSYYLSNQGNKSYQLNTTAFRNGIYFMQLTTDKGIINKRFIVAK